MRKESCYCRFTPADDSGKIRYILYVNWRKPISSADEIEHIDFLDQSSPWRDLQLLGENYIKQMKRDLTPLTFQTSILCQRIGIAYDGFYSSMKEAHKYDANDNAFLDTLGYSFDFSVLGSKSDADVNTRPTALQRALERNGFQYRGIIHVADGSERLAYQLSPLASDPSR